MKQPEIQQPSHGTRQAQREVTDMGERATYSDPLERFEREHQHALRELERLEHAVSELEAGGAEQALETAREVHGFLSTEVREHNENEEKALFPMLEEQGPCEPFIEEHEELRELERRLAEALDSGDPAARVPPVARDIIGLLRSHIDREDNMLFPMSRDMLGTEGLRVVAKRLEAES